MTRNLAGRVNVTLKQQQIEQSALAFEEGIDNWWRNNNPYDNNSSSTAYLHASYEAGKLLGREEYEDKMSKKS